MVVDLGETEILKGQVTQALDGIVRGETLFSNLLEQLAKGLGIHADVIVDWAGWAEARSAKSTTGDTEEHRETHTGKPVIQATFWPVHGLMWCFVDIACRTKIKSFQSLT